jgi:hypothetical protein
LLGLGEEDVVKECWSLGAGEEGEEIGWREGVLVIRREERGLRKLPGMTGNRLR